MAIKYKPDAPTKPGAGQRLIKAAKNAQAIARNEVEPVAALVKPGPKPTGKAKKLISLRLDPDVIEGFKSTGEGWQGRINTALRKSLNL